MKSIQNGLLTLLVMVIPTMAALGQGTSFVKTLIGNNVDARIVRDFDGARQVLYYLDGDDKYLALVDTAGPGIRVKLDRSLEVTDVCVCDHDVFFCGNKNDCAVLGHVDFPTPSAISSPPVTYITFGPTEITQLTRLVAYGPRNFYKIVAIGYLLDTTTVGCGCPYPYPPYRCKKHIMVEADYIRGTFANATSIITSDITCTEELEDLIETDSYLAVITKYRQGNAMAIHRCDKNNVIPTFAPFHYYPVAAYEEGLTGYVGCAMEGNSIAVVSEAKEPGNDQSLTHLRTFDLNTMVMTGAQQIHVSDHGGQITFLSMDRIFGWSFVACGGGFYIRNLRYTGGPSSNCHWVSEFDVTNIETVPMQTVNYDRIENDYTLSPILAGVPDAISVENVCTYSQSNK